MKTQRSISFSLENKTNIKSSVYISFDNEITKTINETFLNKDFEVKVLNEEEMISSDYPNINKNNDFVLGELTEEQSSFTTTLLRVQYVGTEKSKKEDFLNINIFNLKKDIKRINSQYVTGKNISALQQQQTIVDIVESNNLEVKNSVLFDFKENPTLNFYIPANMKIYVTLFGYINSETSVSENAEVLETCN